MSEKRRLADVSMSVCILSPFLTIEAGIWVSEVLTTLHQVRLTTTCKIPTQYCHDPKPATFSCMFTSEGTLKVFPNQIRRVGGYQNFSTSAQISRVILLLLSTVQKTDYSPSSCTLTGFHITRNRAPMVSPWMKALRKHMKTGSEKDRDVASPTEG